jgi:hypothetical protein
MSESEEHPPIGKVEVLFRGLIERNPPGSKTRYTGKSLFHPITTSEVAKAKEKWPNHAPGPDRIQPGVVAKIPDAPLAFLFSIGFLRKIIPEIRREVRTVIIHKDGPRTKTGKSYNVVGLDVHNAFDSLPT